MHDKPIKTFNTSIFDRVLETGSVAERVALASQLAQLACDEKASGIEREAIVPALMRLSKDDTREVRSVLAGKLAHCATLHHDIVFSIVADDEEIALPFLSETTAIDRLRALAILKVGDKPRQIILAGKAGLHADVVSFICDICDAEVCVTLLDNHDVHIKATDYRRLYVRFRDNADVTEGLLKRQDLPLEVRILQAKRAAGNVQRLMAERGWIDARDAETIIVDAEETTLLQILAQASEHRLDDLVPFLSSKSLLTPSLILRAACHGNLAMVVRSLAYLGDVSTGKVQKAVDKQSFSAIRSVYNRAGLPRNCVAIVNAAVVAKGQVAQMPDASARQRYGALLVEHLMTGDTSKSASDKNILLGIVARIGDETTRQLAKRLMGQLRLAA